MERRECVLHSMRYQMFYQMYIPPPSHVRLSSNSARLFGVISLVEVDATPLRGHGGHCLRAGAIPPRQCFCHHLSVRVYTCVCVCACACAWLDRTMYTFECVRACVCVRAQKHTHTHTHMGLPARVGLRWACSSPASPSQRGTHSLRRSHQLRTGRRPPGLVRRRSS